MTGRALLPFASRGGSCSACAVHARRSRLPGAEGADARSTACSPRTRRPRRTCAWCRPRRTCARTCSSSAASRRSTCRSARAAATAPQLFDTWDDYVSALGFPDYRLDIPRQTQTNALMVATFERLGVALCDRAVEHDLKGRGSAAAGRTSALIFAFDVPRGDRRRAGASPRASTCCTAPSSATPRRSRRRSARPRFFQLYRDIVAGPRQGGPEVPLHAATRPAGRPSVTASYATRSSTSTEEQPMKTSREGRSSRCSAAGAAAAFAGLPSIDFDGRRRRDELRPEFFVFIIALGGLGRDALGRPAQRAARHRRIPASTENTDTGPLKRWVDAPLGDAGFKTFELVRPQGSNLVFGPGIGDLADMADRITVVNGLEMNTVAHPDGQVFSTTGRHPQGGRVAASSIDTMLSNELGREQLFPTVSVRFPSAYVGDNLDRRVVPARDRRRRVHQPHALARASSTTRAPSATASRRCSPRRRATSRSAPPTPTSSTGWTLQYDSLRRMLGEQPAGRLQRRRPAQGAPGARLQGALHGRPGGQRRLRRRGDEAQRRPLRELRRRRLRHARQQLPRRRRSSSRRPSTSSRRSSARSTRRRTRRRPAPSSRDHTHILVVSDFCRTPQINLGDGTRPLPEQLGARRLAALPEQLRLRQDGSRPAPAACRRSKFVDGERAIAPPDLLATFLSAFGVDPRKYMRDGEVVPELLRS